ncbi:MAG TPA: anhydro-N-acetylmuramic acid kinase [Candidatus Kapabacteria bacterium]|nr:anhydro-N-acetylmuramic acid kinase [Candidatus Kapabacteria bacterium]
MIVAGIMSGTSADGINVALVRISGKNAHLRIHLLGHSEYPYPKEVRQAVLGAMNAERASVANLSRLNFLLGELYSDAVRKTQAKFRVKAQIIGCHGQTIYHQGEAARFLGRKVAVTWQIGEGAVLAARLGVPVVSDFRPADMAAGGKGAPLVPYLDHLLYRDKRVGRIVQNIGGIANLTAIPAGAWIKNIFAFDTGPGNMVIDAVTEKLFNKPYDKDGKIAASGQVIERALANAMKSPFFSRRPPKTAGREEFGRTFAQNFIKSCGRVASEDIVATATALTADSITQAISRFVLPRGRFSEFVVSGGGANNPTLMAMLANNIRPLKLQLRFSDEFGIPAAAKEAVAFAVLAYETWHRRPSNVPSATGAKRAAILGKVSYA